MSLGSNVNKFPSDSSLIVIIMIIAELIKAIIALAKLL